ncbi:hypothetical protein EDB81DRAFT_884736 [Dactylonectria macrodidyma]|uniref:Uncharacterized protein n=1 Tax=Dactylonectria macrodidyma TaxID=307937 RepID=A0A9P9EPN0_9HYPO|nr:hypothetical protein EDB81DRAFT_884736 [Dactylonectria macrodidyma]
MASHAIEAKYRELGGDAGFLGRATTSLTQDIGIDGTPGCHIDYNGGSIYWTSTEGAHVIYGQIYQKWISVGGPKSNLGYPKTDEASTQDGQGRFNDFAINGADTGSVYWTLRNGAFLIYGSIWLKWRSFGGETSFLGYPITDEASTPDGQCRFNDFAKDGNVTGSIYWTRSLGAFLIYGQIFHKWKSIGGEGGFLGYPITDEASTPDGQCRFNDFAKDGNVTGSIYWTRDLGAFLIYGQIFLKWKSTGGESGVLGYPTTDESPAGDRGGRYNDFNKGGSIYWSPSTGAHVITGALPPKLSWERINIVFPRGVAAGGSVNLIVTSGGHTTFSGGLHDSGLVGYDYGVACVFVDADNQPWLVSRSGSISGTLGTGDRQDNFNIESNRADLARNWRAIAAANPKLHTEARVDVSLGSIINALIQSIGVAQVIALL